MRTVKILMIGIMLSMSSIASAQTVRGMLKAFQKVLDAYCVEYYNTDFSGRSYIEESLVVSIPSDPEDALNPLTGAFELNGTHSYKGQTRQTHSGVKWRATIKMISNTKYRIKFDKWYEKDPIPTWLGGREAHWELGPTREFEYKQ